MLGIISRRTKSKHKSVIKKPVTAYNIFMKKQRSNISKNFSNKSHNEVNKEVANSWKRLSNEEKKEYEIEAYFDSVRYYEECRDLGKEIDPPKNYSIFRLCNSVDGKRRIAEKSIKIRRNYEFKKPRSAFVLYTAEQYKEIDQSLHTQNNFKNKARILSEKWNNLSSEKKEIYYKKAKDERNEYFDKMNLLN